MTPLNTIIEEIMNEWCDKYGHFLAFESDALTDLTTAMQRAYEAGQSEERAKIREEVEKDRLPVDGEMVDEARLVRKSFNAGLDAVLAKLTPDKTV